MNIGICLAVLPYHITYFFNYPVCGFSALNFNTISVLIFARIFMSYMGDKKDRKGEASVGWSSTTVGKFQFVVEIIL